MKTLRWTLCVLALGGYGCVTQAPEDRSDPMELVALAPLPAEFDGPLVSPVDEPRADNTERELPTELWQSAAHVRWDLDQRRHNAADERTTELVNELNGLELFEAGDVVVEFPEGTECIYACRQSPGAVSDQERKNLAVEAMVDQAHRLEERADDINMDVTRDEALAHLDTLRDLEVIKVYDLVEQEPVARAECYNLPCPQDIADAEEENARRRGVIAALAAVTTGLESQMVGRRCGQAEAETEALLNELRGLSLFETEDLIAARSAGAPCFYVGSSDEPWVREWEAQINRLDRLVLVAETVRSLEDNHVEADVDEALDAIDSLEIVEVGEMLENLPQSAGSCYVCPDVSEEEASDHNARRAADIITIADLSEEL